MKKSIGKEWGRKNKQKALSVNSRRKESQEGLGERKISLFDVTGRERTTVIWKSTLKMHESD